MKKYTIRSLILVFAFIAATACSTIDVPDEEESRSAIAVSSMIIGLRESALKLKTAGLPEGSDLIFRMRMNAVNRILRAFAEDKQNDLDLFFLKTEKIFEENSEVLGIKFTNYIGIDRGSVKLNLERFEFVSFSGNVIKTKIRITGTGQIDVSGKYAGVPARVSPYVDLEIDELVNFNLKAQANGSLRLEPENKEIKLRTTISIKLLEWKIPWSKDIKLKLQDLIEPIELPAAIDADIELPLPAKEFDVREKIEYVPYVLKIRNSKSNLENDNLEYKADLEFIRK